MTDRKYRGAFQSNNGITIHGGDIADYIGDDGVTHRVVIVGDVYSDGDADIAHYFDGNPGPGNVKWRHLRVLDDSVKKSFKAFWESGEALEKQCEYCGRQFKNRGKCSRHDCPLKQLTCPSVLERDRLLRLLVRECSASVTQANRILESVHAAGFSVINTIQLRPDQVDHALRNSDVKEKVMKLLEPIKSHGVIYAKNVVTPEAPPRSPHDFIEPPLPSSSHE